LFSNPNYFRFNADLEMSVNLKNNKTVEQGTTLFGSGNTPSSLEKQLY